MHIKLLICQILIWYFNLQFKKYKNQLNLPHYVDTKYFQTSTNFIIRNKNLPQNSNNKEFYKVVLHQVYLLIYIYVIMSLNLKTIIYYFFDIH